MRRTAVENQWWKLPKCKVVLENPLGNGNHACVDLTRRWISTSLGVTLLHLVWGAVCRYYVSDVAAPCGFVRPRWKVHLRGSSCLAPLMSAQVHLGLNFTSWH